MSDSEVHIKQGYITEFFHAGKMAHSSTHSEHLWSGCEHSEVVCFSSGDSIMKDKPCSRWPCTGLTPWNGVPHSAHPYRLAYLNLGMVYRAEYQLQCIGNNDCKVGILQCLQQVGPTNAHTKTQRAPYTSLTGPIEPMWSWMWQFLGSHHYWYWDVMLPLQAGVKMAICGVVMCEFPTEEKFQDIGLSG